MTDLSHLRGLIERATKGPWYTLGPPWLTHGDTSILAESPDPHVARFICDFDLWAIDEDDRKSLDPDADAALIVAAVNSLPALLDEIERLREAEAALARVRAAIECAPTWPRDALDRMLAEEVAGGLSLRQCATKHAVGLGRVRGAVARLALTPNKEPDHG